MPSANTILDLLTVGNPRVIHQELRSKANTNSRNSPFTGPVRMLPWDEFSFEGLRTIFNKQLFRSMRQTLDNPINFPNPYEEDLVVCEDDPETWTKDILHNWNRFIVRAALRATTRSLNPCDWTPCASLASGKHDPNNMWSPEMEKAATEAAFGKRGKKGDVKKRRLIPDAGTALLCCNPPLCALSKIERLPKEYKPALKFNSADVVAHINKNGSWKDGTEVKNECLPIRQAYTYSLYRGCRYGCILTTKEAFFFRIKPDKPENGQPLFDNLDGDGVMQYKSISWDERGEKKLTFNLALYFIHVLAGNGHELQENPSPILAESVKSHDCGDSVSSATHLDENRVDHQVARPMNAASSGRLGLMTSEDEDEKASLEQHPSESEEPVTMSFDTDMSLGRSFEKRSHARAFDSEGSDASRQRSPSRATVLKDRTNQNKSLGGRQIKKRRSGRLQRFT